MISCKSPKVLLAHSLKENVLRCRNYVIDGTVYYLTDTQYFEWSEKFPFSFFYSYANQVNVENNDFTFMYYCFDENGEYPLFQIVPCGKCELCRQKSIMEWRFRAICENATAKTPPTLITLTYKEFPTDGLLKRDLQLFIKRLRKKCPDCNLRYIACGEYGSRRGHPHYHLAMWNLPYTRTELDFYNLIAETWQTGENSYNKGFVQVTRLDGKQNSRYTNNDATKAITYVIKYLHKDCPNKLGYKNEPFILTSRRGGIGSEYREKMRTFYQQHPEQTSISVLDPFSGKVTESFLPRYFKKLYFPTVSQMIPKEIRDLRNSVVDEVHNFRMIQLAMQKKDVNLFDNTRNLVLNLIPFRKFEEYQFLQLKTENHLRKTQEYFSINKMPLPILEHRLIVSALRLEGMLSVLHYYVLDKEFINKYLSKTKRQNDKIKELQKFDESSPESIDTKYDKYVKLRMLAKKREFF